MGCSFQGGMVGEQGALLRAPRVGRGARLARTSGGAARGHDHKLTTLRRRGSQAGHGEADERRDEHQVGVRAAVVEIRGRLRGSGPPK